MAHHTMKKSVYENLAERLNRFPQGAPPSETLYKILELLFSPEEARLAALLPIKPFTAKKAAKSWKLSEAESAKILEKLAGKAILLDIEKDGEVFYVLPPPMAGFFEFSMMRLRGDIDQKILARLFYQYLNVEEDFIRALFEGGETQLGRVFVNEGVLSPENSLHVLDYERATEVIRTASEIGVGICYCRHKMEHAGKRCGAPMEICMTFNSSASSLVKHGYARKIDASECLDLLDLAGGHNLVQFGENVRKNVNFICNCCSCCCEALVAARKYGMLQPVHTTNFLPEVDSASCTGCGRCVDVCPVQAASLVSACDPDSRVRKIVRIDESICLGCGLCLKVCPSGALKLKSRKKRVITPVDSVHKAVVMAVERGKLQNLIFDNQLMLSHRAMAAVLGSVLRLPYVKQKLASAMLNSRYLENLVEKHSRGR